VRDVIKRTSRGDTTDIIFEVPEGGVAVVLEEVPGVPLPLGRPDPDGAAPLLPLVEEGDIAVGDGVGNIGIGGGAQIGEEPIGMDTLFKDTQPALSTAVITNCGEQLGVGLGT